jgi:hypothetical protein
VWDNDCRARIVCSDLDTLVIFHPPLSPMSCDIVYERSILRGDLVQLRIIIAAYLYVALPEDMCIYHPLFFDRFDLTLTEGSPIDPLTPMQTDEEVFATHHRHSDFDFHTLARDADRGLQFFRWKDNINKNASPIFASPGETLRGITDGFIRRNIGISPYYPVEDVPSETVDHIRSVQRSCPMGPILELFLSSKAFAIRLLEDITPRTGKGLCRTYKCQIVSIDGEMRDASPVLCLKLFDDRFIPMETPDEDMIKAGVQWWWMRYCTTEDHVRNEDAAYKRLKFVQGSLIPWFYGSHLVSYTASRRRLCLIDPQLLFPMATMYMVF